MKVFKNLNLNGKITDIVCDGGIIKSVGKTDAKGVDLGGRKVYPGLIDIHTHGIGGFDTMDAVPEKTAPLYAACGTTTFYPTTMTASHGDIVRAIKVNTAVVGATIEGFHLEGPYINKKYCGAQNTEYIRNPDVSEFAGFDNVKIVTLAPELDGAEEYIKKSPAVICVGHTAADYAAVCAAADAGLKCVTHTFNAMPPLHHREPAVGGAAYDKNLYVQVICDGIHIHPAVIRMLYKLFGAGKMILISDSMRATLLPDGEYDLGGQKTIVKNKIARTETGALAGSTSTLFDCVKHAVEFGIPERDAFRMASETPAKMMGLKKGAIKVGYACDFIALDEKGDIAAVVIGGEKVKGDIK